MGFNPWKVCKTNLTNEKNQGKTASKALESSEKRWKKIQQGQSLGGNMWKLWVCMHPHAQAPPWCYSADGSILSQVSQPEQPGSSGRISNGSYPSVCIMKNINWEAVVGPRDSSQQAIFCMKDHEGLWNQPHAGNRNKTLESTENIADPVSQTAVAEQWD